MTETLNKVDTLAKIGSSLLSVQIEAFDVEAGRISKDLWVLGYCFGLFDCMAQYARLDQFTEGTALMRSGFGKLVGSEPNGAALFEQAVGAVESPIFNEGMAAGEADLLAWADNVHAQPSALTRHMEATRT